MRTSVPTKIIDLTPYLQRPRQERRRELYALLALWTQYLSLGFLLLYGLLRMLNCPHIPLGAYVGPLAALWPTSFFLLLVSFTADKLLCQEDNISKKAHFSVRKGKKVSRQRKNFLTK